MNIMYKSFAMSIVIFTSCSMSAQSHKQVMEDVKKLKWLCHTWERTDMRPGQKAFESWTEIGDELYQGYGVTIQAADTVFREELKILVKDDKLYYVADVSHNEAPVYFEISTRGEHSFVSSNAHHDFPKEISYSIQGDRMTVVISGDGKSVAFNFVRWNE